MITNYKNFALDLSRKAGEIMKKNFSLNMIKELKADKTFVTETDLAINSMVLEAVHEAFPEHGTITEEYPSESADKEFVWVCDPVDGTIPFSHGVPTSVFSLALVQNGKSILGVVNDPFLDRTYFAQKGDGALMNGKTIKVNQNPDINRSVVGLCGWVGAYDMPAVWAEILKHGGIGINVMSAVYMGVMVANGEFSAAIFPGATPWDSAAVKIIVDEAGGKVTDLAGNEAEYNKDSFGHLASNGLLHNELIEIVSKIIKK